MENLNSNNYLENLNQFRKLASKFELSKTTLLKTLLSQSNKESKENA